LRIFPTPLSVGAYVTCLCAYVMRPDSLRGEVNHEETRGMGLPCGESCYRFWLIHSCDGGTDRQTDGQAIALYYAVAR